ncbi:ATP-binding protein [Streptomyces sp. 8P21H-1]|uniref:ATP-binding protein n=1 Tax=Streptomyces sp. 8P21H-1 TaxID=2737048 RepID=UPI0020C6ED37|nr:ATP-binding protein [Streptomyces sp. 8P21H-1]
MSDRRWRGHQGSAGSMGYDGCVEGAGRFAAEQGEQSVDTGHMQRKVDSAAGAREEVRRVLGDFYGARADDDPAVRTTVGDALLVTSELVTNAIRHGGGLLGFEARVSEDELVLHVTDASPREPATPATAHPGTPGGFGWALVRRLCREVAVRRRPDGGGKTITARLAL